MLRHHHTHDQEISASIQHHPEIKTLRTTRRIMLVGLIILLVFFLLFEGWMVYQNSLYPQLSPQLSTMVFPLAVGIPVLLLMTVSLVSHLKQERYWRRIEEGRFQALRGDRHLLASKQPSPDAEAMELPATIRMRSTSRAALANALIFFTVAIGGYLFFALWLLHQTWQSCLPYLLFAGLFLLVIPLISRFARSTILVSAEGIRVPAPGGHAWVAWHEIRLFACYCTQESVKNGAALTYELSTASTIIRWTWLHRRTFWSAEVPELSLAEHTAQMTALANLVIARTGLPLYDLSKAQSGKQVTGERTEKRVPHPQRSSAQAHMTSPMLCSNPLLGHLKAMRFLYLGLPIFIFVIIFFDNVIFSLSGLTGHAGLAGFWAQFLTGAEAPILLSLLWLAIALLTSFVERAWKRLEHLRFSAAAGNERLRALNQPQPDTGALYLPSTITLRITRTFAFFVALAFFMGVLLFWLLIDLVNAFSRYFFLSWPVNGIFLAILVTIAWGAYVLFARRRMHIKVDDEGIRVSQSKQVETHVSWQEARLFACYAAPMTRRAGAELTYELSSGSNLVRWSCAQRVNSPWLMWTATIPFEEHQAQMQALVALIAARTGLTLYDLNQEP